MLDLPDTMLATDHQDRSDTFARAVGSLLCHRADLRLEIARSLRQDPDFALGHALDGFVALSMTRPIHDARCATSLASALAALARRGGTDRERLIVEALSELVRGNVSDALARLDAVVSGTPADLMTIKLAHAVRFQAGDVAGLLQATSAVIGRWTPNMPGFGHVLGCHAFALCENGRYGEAERIGRKAVECAPSDPWAVHSVAHVYEMTGDPRSGLAWLDQCGECRNGIDAFGQHLEWHRALFLIDLGRLPEALEIFDAGVWPVPSQEYREIANAVSLLWRLEEAGIPVGDRWSRVAGSCELLLQESRLGFAQVHAGIGLLKGGRPLPARAASPHSRLTETILEGLDHIAAGEDADGARALAGCRSGWKSLGGSNAQRDLFFRIAFQAAIGAGLVGLARLLLEERNLLFEGSHRYARRFDRISAWRSEQDPVAAVPL